VEPEELTVEQLLARLSTLILGLSPGHPVRVGVDGPSAAGKSTLATALAGSIARTGRPSYFTSIDDFHPPGYKLRAARPDGFASPEEYLREGYDFEAFRRIVLEPAGPDGNRRCRLAWWKSFEDEAYPEHWVELAESAVIVAEAAFSLLPVFESCWELVIWLDIDADTMLARVVNRDTWIGDREEILRGYRQRWLPRHEYYERTYLPRDAADIVVDNRRPDRPRIVKWP